MARRKQTIIDGTIVDVQPDSTIRDVLTMAGIDHIPNIVSGGEVISARDFNRPIPPHDIITNQRNMDKGASFRDRLLNKKFDLISGFLGKFDGIPRSVQLDHNYILINGFPLNDDYLPDDHVNILIVTVGYPDIPPAGIHFPSIARSRDKIAQHLGGHVLSRLGNFLPAHIPESYRNKITKFSNALADNGWVWICFHYQDWRWKFNPVNIMSGDCLYKYCCENLFAALSGGYR